MKPIPLFGSGVKSFSASITAQRRVNCFYDIRVDGDKTKVTIRGTPGSFGQISLPDSPVRGMYQQGAYLFIVAGVSVFRVSNDHSFILLGTISNSSQYVDISDNFLQLLIVDGVRGYYVTLPSGAPTLITDVNFPNGATTCAVLNSRMIAERPNSREFAVSAQLDVTNWTPGIFGTKENTSDQLIAVDVLNGNLILWGPSSMEFWQDVGLSPLPYQRIGGASQSWGLAAKFSRGVISNTIAFLGQNPQGGVQVLMLNGYTPQRISTSDIEDIITGFAIKSDAVAFVYMVDGHPMYQLTFPSANRSFFYDVGMGIWYEAQSGVGDYVRHFANLGVVFHSENYVSDVNTGVISQLTTDLYTEGGAPIKRLVTSRHLRMDGNEFGVSEIRLEMDTGVGLTSGQGSEPQIMMRVSKDDGKTFGPEKWKSFGRQGQYGKKVVWDRLGSSHDFVFQWTVTDPVKFVINLGEAVLSPGTEIAQ